jgi:hypothetical protein
MAKEKEILNSEYWRNLYKKFLDNELSSYINSFYKIDPEREKKIPKIRQKIFGDQEFIELSKRIISHNPALQEYKIFKRVYKFDNFFYKLSLNRLNKSYNDKEFYLILDLFFSKSFSRFAEILTQYFYNQNFNFKSLIISLSNEYTTSYIPYYFYQVDEATKQNFYVNFSDEIFSFNVLNHKEEVNPDFEIIYITEELRNNPFFAKRMSNSFLEKIHFILLYKTILGNMDFLYIYFFDTQERLNLFLKNKEYLIINQIIHNIYFLFKREDNILFENKQKILKRMVFSYIYYHIKKILSIHKEIIIYKIIFDEDITDFNLVNKNIQLIKNYFNKNKQFILVRNHFYQILIIIKNQKELQLELENILKKIEPQFSVDYKITINIYNKNTWSFLNI